MAPRGREGGAVERRDAARQGSRGREDSRRHPEPGLAAELELAQVPRARRRSHGSRRGRIWPLLQGRGRGRSSGARRAGRLEPPARHAAMGGGGGSSLRLTSEEAWPDTPRAAPPPWIRLRAAREGERLAAAGRQRERESRGEGVRRTRGNKRRGEKKKRKRK
ncbi:hypothetical protein PVAP13_2NG570820 [Panicum virgatum]|uniref:Uncharacterized protein n=1 Tax=Panicum virgatum TaxID=38727 RepID=A0A8T0VSX6_PANVG|nr:hypothetical protein PVAP13_2NG570820 [Panicum virgatum]